MKTKLLCCVFLLTFFGNAFSQEYHALLNNTTWIVTRMVSCCVPMRVEVASPGDEIVVGDYTYIGYTNPFAGYDSNVEDIATVYVRENTTERKVYKLVEGIDTLLYDFSMETGDTITQYGYTWTATVDEVSTNAGMRKRITLLAPYNSHRNVKQIWIEGIGTNKHPFYPTHNMYSFMSAGGGIMVSTACVYQNGDHTFGEEDCSAMLSTTSEIYTNPNIDFSPNPVTSELTFNSERPLQNASFRLYNIQGQLVREMDNLDGRQFTVKRDQLSSGLYLVELSEDGKLVKTAKIIVD